MTIDRDDVDSFEQVERTITQISWLGQRQFMQLLAEERFDMTIPQFYTLLHLAHCPSEMKMSDLARATHQSAASLTGVVDRLLEKRLVQRVRPEGDRRQVMVMATEHGRALLFDIVRARHEEIQQALNDLRADEIKELLRLLNGLLAGMLRLVEGRERH